MCSRGPFSGDRSDMILTELSQSFGILNGASANLCERYIRLSVVDSEALTLELLTGAPSVSLDELCWYFFCLFFYHLCSTVYCSTRPYKVLQMNAGVVERGQFEFQTCWIEHSGLHFTRKASERLLTGCRRDR